MPSNSKLDPTGERAEATEAMESTPISGKEHEYRADGDHHPRQDAAEVEAGAGAARPISQGIPDAGRSSETGEGPDAQRDRSSRA